MQPFGALILGGGQAGAQAASSLRALGWSGPITLAGEERVAPYQRPPLSKGYLMGELAAERLEAKPAAFYAEAKITLALGARATAIDRRAQEVWFEGGARRRYEVLILALGAKPRRLDVPGADLKGVHVLRTRADADAIRAALNTATRVAVVGGGYIGLEVAAAARKAGVEAVVLEAAPRLLARVAGPELADFYALEHASHGVKVVVDAAVTGFEGSERLEAVLTKDGQREAADLAVVGIGVAPNDHLASAAGLTCDNGIMTDAAGRTSDPAIFAIGDCARAYHPLYGRALRFESVQNALDGAKACAAAILDAPIPPAQAPWNWSDQYDVKLQTAGVADGADQIVRRDGANPRSFSLFAMDRGRVIACDAVNAPAEFMAARRLIAQRTVVAPERLSDTSVSMKELLAA